MGLTNRKSRPGFRWLERDGAGRGGKIPSSTIWINTKCNCILTSFNFVYVQIMNQQWMFDRTMAAMGWRIDQQPNWNRLVLTVKLTVCLVILNEFQNLIIHISVYRFFCEPHWVDFHMKWFRWAPNCPHFTAMHVEKTKCHFSRWN